MDDSAAWPDEEVEEEDAQDELDATAPAVAVGSTPDGQTETARQTTGGDGQTGEEEDMDNVEALMAGVKLDEKEDTEVRG